MYAACRCSCPLARRRASWLDRQFWDDSLRRFRTKDYQCSGTYAPKVATTITDQKSAETASYEHKDHLWDLMVRMTKPGTLVFPHKDASSRHCSTSSTRSSKSASPPSAGGSRWSRGAQLTSCPWYIEECNAGMYCENQSSLRWPVSWFMSETGAGPRPSTVREWVRFASAL